VFLHMREMVGDLIFIHPTKTTTTTTIDLVAVDLHEISFWLDDATALLVAPTGSLLTHAYGIRKLHGL
jgi:hypothetical protein